MLNLALAVACAPPPPPPIHRYRARVAYDGGGFLGMQYQPNGRTVQGALQAALAQRCNLPGVKVVAASRTDSGVHARGQAIHFDLDHSGYEPSDLERSLFRLLSRASPCTDARSAEIAVRTHARTPTVPARSPHFHSPRRLCASRRRLARSLYAGRPAACC